MIDLYGATEFGHTNNPAAKHKLDKYINDMVNDGWSFWPTYGAAESFLSAITLERLGYKCVAVNRTLEPGLKFRYECAISMWGPDGLRLDVPEKYSWSEVLANAEICDICRSKHNPSHRYSFAGRCCEKCLATARQRFEPPGWCD